MDSCNFTNKTNLHIVSVTWAAVFIWENSYPGYQDLGGKSKDLGNWASLASHMNTSKFLRRKEWQGEISYEEAPTHY